MINESNYHIYLDDFVAGLLDEEMEMEFVAFLDQHPSILEEETLEISDVHLDSSFQASLKKEIPLDAQHIDEFLIASLEGDLSSSQENELTQFLSKHPQYVANKELIQLTKLEADTALVFEDKSSLKKRPAIYLYTRWAASAAAVLILGMMVFRFLGSGDVPAEQFAQNPAIEIAPIELPAISVEGESARVESIEEADISRTFTPALAAESTQPKRKPSEHPETVPLQYAETIALETPELQDLSLLPLAITAPVLESDPQFASNSNELSVFQWAYKKLRGKVGMPEMVVPEHEIPQDVANIVMAKVAPIIQLEPNGTGSRIRIGGVEINRRSAHQN